VKYINGVGRDILGCDPGVTHDGDAGTYFLVLTAAFQLMGERVVRSHLMAHLMDDVVDIEVIAHRNAVRRRSNSAAF
jgi:hypothetical protein